MLLQVEGKLAEKDSKLQEAEKERDQAEKERLTVVACSEVLKVELAGEHGKRQRLEGERDQMLASVKGLEQYVGSIKAAVGE